MMKRLFKAVLVLTLAGGGSAVVIPSAFAYGVGNSCTGSAPFQVAGGQPFTFSVPCRLSNGQPVPAGTQITFSQSSGPTASVRHTSNDLQLGAAVQPAPNAATTCLASFNPVVASTNSSGTASTTVTLPTGCPGSYVLTATASTGGSTTVTVVEVGGFPNTSANAATPRGVTAWLAIAVGAALLGMAISAGVSLLRMRVSH